MTRRYLCFGLRLQESSAEEEKRAEIVLLISVPDIIVLCQGVRVDGAEA